MAAQATPIGIKGKGSKSVTRESHRAIVRKARRLRAVKKAEAVLVKERKELSKFLADSMVEDKVEQYTLDGEPLVTAVEVEDTNTDLAFIARRAPKTFEKATTPKWYLRLDTNANATLR